MYYLVMINNLRINLKKYLSFTQNLKTFSIFLNIIPYCFCIKKNLYQKERGKT